jgi:hypothetical protein
MAAFFAKTWFLWYAFAVVIIMRWFHVAALDSESDDRATRRVENPNPPVSNRLKSSLSEDREVGAK